MTNPALGYRGYNGSRAYHGLDFPQNVQNMIIRNYCQKYQLPYLLSVSEYRMPGCFMILEEVLASIQSVDGIVLFSIFMLPNSLKARQRIYDKILQAGRSLHGALEDVAVKTQDDIQLIEDILRSNKIALTDQDINNLLCSLDTPFVSRSITEQLTKET
jgi:sporadic carbohydrate cluster protein (TIGR04323 family)